MSDTTLTLDTPTGKIVGTLLLPSGTGAALGLVLAVAIGSLFFVGCHGVLAYAETRVPSGLSALCLATIPLFVPLLMWWLAGGHRPSRRTACSALASSPS